MKLFDPANKELKKCTKIAEAVVALENKYKALSDDELKAKTVEFKERLNKGETLDDIMVEAFATAREASTRVIGLTPFKVQIIGAAAMHFGNIAEMKTGEGKTLTSVLVAYLNALTGKGVHIVTVNEYLASRDAKEMGEIHNFLGITVGLNLRELEPDEKRAQYNCDITYSTNSELGFDYLRDHMVLYKEQMVQRPEMNFAIVDEVDSILIDEARTPLIISGGEKKGANFYLQSNTFVRGLKEEDYEIDVKDRHVTLLESGMAKAEKFFNVENLYDMKNVGLVHYINNALRANYIMEKDKDYVVHDGAVVIVDPFTGRLMVGRQWSDGLHQAVEAKENVQIKKETRTLATITYQNYFRMYHKLAGMTGTAKTEEEEFQKVYNMNVVVIPTNKPLIRCDDTDMVYGTEEAKYKAIVNEIKKRHALGQPILVGTVSVEKSEMLSNLLNKEGLPHEVLNAKNHEREAHIIEQAGQMGAITIATNMAGRGTDIKLGPGVREIKDTADVHHAAGLCVIGTERHEARRIDNQLRGRSGRQGDPGYSRFFVCCDDELILRFGSDMLRNAFLSLGDEGLNNKMVTNAITSAQKKIEGQNFDTRKSLMDYDDVLRQQRKIMYEQRDKVLYSDSIYDTICEYFHNTAKKIVNASLNGEEREKFLDGKLLKANLEPKYLPEGSFNEEGYTDAPLDEATDDIAALLLSYYNQKRNTWPEGAADQVEKMVALSRIDRNWTTHIDSMSKLREGIHLRSYAQTNPLQDYVREGFQMFDEMIETISDEVTLGLIRAQVRVKTEAEIAEEKKQLEEANNPENKGEDK